MNGLGNIGPALPIDRDGILLDDGTVVQITRRNHGHLWDRVQVGTSITAGQTTTYFGRTNGVTTLDTNMEIARMLPSGVFQIQRVGVYLQQAVKLADAQKILDGGVFRLFVNDNKILEAPIFAWQSGYGLVGSVADTNTDTTNQIVTNGVASTGASQTLAIPIALAGQKDTFYGEIVYPAAITLTAQTYVYVLLEGFRGIPIRS